MFAFAIRDDAQKISWDDSFTFHKRRSREIEEVMLRCSKCKVLWDEGQDNECSCVAVFKHMRRNAPLAIDIAQRKTKCYSCDEDIRKGCVRIHSRTVDELPDGRHFPRISYYHVPCWRNITISRASAINNPGEQQIKFSHFDGFFELPESIQKHVQAILRTTIEAEDGTHAASHHSFPKDIRGADEAASPPRRPPKTFDKQCLATTSDGRRCRVRTSWTRAHGGKRISESMKNAAFPLLQDGCWTCTHHSQVQINPEIIKEKEQEGLQSLLIQKQNYERALAARELWNNRKKRRLHSRSI